MPNWEHGEEPVEQFHREAERLAQQRGSEPITDARMVWQFQVDDAGLVWVVPDERFPGFAQALADSVTALSPAGSSPSLSAYWIERTLAWLVAADQAHDAVQLASGNMSALEREGDLVRAVSLYDTFEPEVLPADEVISGLLAWRRVVRAQPLPVRRPRDAAHRGLAGPPELGPTSWIESAPLWS